MTRIGEAPETHYARSASVHLAFQSFGEGDLELVLVPGFVSHLEFAWEYPPYRRFMSRLAAFARVTVYDKRGTGLSDPLDVAAGFDQHLEGPRFPGRRVRRGDRHRPALRDWLPG